VGAAARLGTGQVCLRMAVAVVLVCGALLSSVDVCAAVPDACIFLRGVAGVDMFAHHGTEEGSLWVERVDHHHRPDPGLDIVRRVPVWPQTTPRKWARGLFRWLPPGKSPRRDGALFGWAGAAEVRRDGALFGWAGAPDVRHGRRGVLRHSRPTLTRPDNAPGRFYFYPPPRTSSHPRWHRSVGPGVRRITGLPLQQIAGVWGSSAVGPVTRDPPRVVIFEARHPRRIRVGVVPSGVVCTGEARRRHGVKPTLDSGARCMQPFSVCWGGPTRQERRQ